MLASALRLLVTVVAMAVGVEGGYRLFLMFTGCMLRAARSLTGLSQQETRRPRFDLAPLPDGLGTRADAEPRSDHSDDEPATIGRQANDDHPRMTQMSMA
jgi:hypothetical protein